MSKKPVRRRAGNRFGTNDESHCFKDIKYCHENVNYYTKGTTAYQHYHSYRLSNGYHHHHHHHHSDNNNNNNTNYRNIQDIESSSSFSSRTISKPISFTNYHVHRHHKKNHHVGGIGGSCSHHNFDRLKVVHPKGLVFVWPKRRRFYYEKELSCLLWMVSNGLYWMHVINLFPNGAALPLEEPPWNYTPPLPIPQTREYIIEPDWDSTYTT
ncbi:uncharacterized protein [Onthophagus taurus]|uniref:uncharacterized protein n=1 Tax=Onthophagus taurus TaxID=166361 RepID=UPI0039BDD6A3